MNSIDRVSAQSVSRAYVQGTDAAQSAPAQQPAKHAHAHRTQAQKADSVTLSDSARSLAAAREAVQNAPDVREAKVADIKQRVDSGTYEVSSKVLARKMIDATKNPT
jgi:negative regulator of flagellin synthesis FlgM